jgi:hypothetical protein
MKLSEIKKYNEFTAVFIEMNGSKIVKTESTTINDLLNVLQEKSVKMTFNYQGDYTVDIKTHIENTEWYKSDLGFTCEEFLGIIPGKVRTRQWVSKCWITLKK